VRGMIALKCHQILQLEYKLVLLEKEQYLLMIEIED
jgi:hypothetical protein